MQIEGESSLRWDPYFMRKGKDFYSFWDQHLKSKKHDILYILGRGFDPRMCIGLEAILNSGGEGRRDSLLICFNEGPDSPSINRSELVNQNLLKLKNLLKNRGQLFEQDVQMWSSTDLNRHRTSSFNAARVVDAISNLRDYTDIIVDIGALPRAIYFSLIAKLLFIIDKESFTRNLHIVVLEDTNLDEEIQEIGIDESASFIYGFADSSMMSESTSRIPIVWIPILGENQDLQLTKILSFVNPQEICPVLPHPSLNPRRSDNLLISYRNIIFDQWSVEPRNIIYASEQNPFDVYRQITKTVLRYNKALVPIGGCKVAISAQSNKLISIGALLAAYDLRNKVDNKYVGIVHIESLGYEINTDKLATGELFNLWIQGECYAP